MNFRIEGQEIRFRISKAELEQILSNHHIKSSTNLPNGKKFNLSIRLVEKQKHEMVVSFKKRKAHLKVQTKALISLYKSLPKREGIKVKQAIDFHLFIDLILEVDIRTQKINTRN